MRVLVAPDKFKGTLTAVEAAQVIGRVLADHGHEVVLAPMADGGDGTLDVFFARGATPHTIATVDAHLRAHTPAVARDGDAAIVEMARVCGMATVLDLPLDPWTASSRGLGLAARAAMDAGARTITLALGGSASIDGGIGMLQALDFRIRDVDGRDVSPDLRGLLSTRDISPPAVQSDITWRALVDVAAPLCGPQGAVAFAQQKGVPIDRLDEIEVALARWGELLTTVHGVDPTRVPGAGAAGGVGAALVAALGANLEPGADAVARLTGLDDALAGCDAVVTGEGRFDRTTASGKAPWIVIEHATAQHIPVHVIAGSIGENAPVGDVTSATACRAAGDREPLDPAASLAEAASRWCRSMTG